MSTFDSASNGLLSALNGICSLHFLFYLLLFAAVKKGPFQVHPMDYLMNEIYFQMFNTLDSAGR